MFLDSQVPPDIPVDRSDVAFVRVALGSFVVRLHIPSPYQ